MQLRPVGRHARYGQDIPTRGGVSIEAQYVSGMLVLLYGRGVVARFVGGLV